MEKKFSKRRYRYFHQRFKINNIPGVDSNYSLKNVRSVLLNTLIKTSNEK